MALASHPALSAEDRPATTPSVMPEPPIRPVELKPEPPPMPATAPALPDAPTPPERPAELTPATPTAPEPGPASEMPVPPPRPTDLSPSPPTTPALALTVTPADDTACRKRLERLGATFEPLPPISNGQCGAEKPLKLSRLSGGVVLNPAATLVCGTAEALARWTTEAQETAEQVLKAPIKSLSIGSTYECRGQNHDPDAKLSEHSFANGVDVMGFGFDGHGPIQIGAGLDGAPEATFQAAVRAKACLFFRTVLGPGSDAAHGNHLHLDERERNAGHRLCQ
ncbi:extensin family protein [Methylobacterium sp. 77]|uniref:extensin-like domain-containing protein n=1 Tax=Methylobacterium sp. 77 TaxID=1101192 RepID=UPI00055BB219|nr:extensin family protein [Methylobacterium sp. 77]